MKIRTTRELGRREGFVRMEGLTSQAAVISVVDMDCRWVPLEERTRRSKGRLGRRRALRLEGAHGQARAVMLGRSRCEEVLLM